MGADLDTTRGAGKRVAVVGGGPAGLTTAKCLLDEGHRPVVFEATDRVGGVWTYRTDRPGGTYLSTRLQTSKYTSHFSDFPFPDAAADFPDTDEINAYLRAYADRFGVAPLVRANARVSAVAPAADGWDVTAGRHRERFDAVAVCTGLLWKPVRPTGVGEDGFPGRVLHSVEYHEPSLFAGKVVVVVGTGVSGADLASDAADVAKSVTWAVRSKRWIIPRVWGFVPGDTQVTPVGVVTDRGAGRDETLRRWRAILPEYMAAYDRSGLLPDTDPGAGALQVNDRVVGLVAAGKVGVSPGFVRFDGPDVVFADGSRTRADVVVFATGYDLAGLPSLHPALRLTDEGIGLYERVFHPDLPGLGVVGWFGTGLGSFPTMELQARWFARVLAGRAELPPPDEMRRRLAADLEQRERLIPSPFGRRFAVHSPLYNIQLAEAIGAFPDPHRDWRAYWEQLQLPGFPAQFRLRGPHPWAGAAEYLNACKRKAFLPPPGPAAERLKRHLLSKFDAPTLRDLCDRGELTPAEFAAVRPVEAAKPAPPADFGFYKPVWTARPLPPSPADEVPLIAVTRRDLDPAALGGRVRVVRLGPPGGERQVSAAPYRIDGSAADWRALLHAFGEAGWWPARVVFDATPADPDAAEAAVREVLEPAFHLTQALFGGRPGKTDHRLCFVFARPAGVATAVADAFVGFAQSAVRENPAVGWKVVSVDRPVVPIAELIRAAADELAAWDSAVEVRYGADGVRRVMGVAPAGVLAPAADPIRVKPGGVYWITGGAGGVGLIFARHFAAQGNPVLVLTGRSPEDAVRRAAVAELRAAGADAVYLQSDVADADAVRRTAAEIRDRWGRIDGILHVAGVTDDDAFARKTWPRVERVLAPKVGGTVSLDAATAGDRLDWFVLFSSLSGLIGNPGQADYGAANRFLDSFAHHRETLRTRGQRVGRTLVLNWPYWAEGGTPVPQANLDAMTRMTGMVPLATFRGLAAFDAAAAADAVQLVPIPGDQDRIAGWVGPPRLHDRDTPVSLPPPPPAPPPPAAGHANGTPPAAGDPAALYGALRDLVVGLLKVDAGDVQPDDPLARYGFDSITLAEFGRRIEERFPFAPPDPTLFLTNPTLAAVADALWAKHPAEFAARFPAPAAARPPLPRPTRPRPVPEVPPSPSPAADEPIAVVGIAGVFPGATDVFEYWRLLVSGNSAISEVPADRWDLREFDGDPKSGPFRTDCRWAGFLPDVAAFDAGFFRMTPREAEATDPQHRLLLQTTWAALEDAGWPPTATRGRRVGVFVGASRNEYATLAAGSGRDLGGFANTGNAPALLVARVSRFFDWTGPSETVDAACAGSAAAIHRAVRAIRAGDCEAAVAGGVSLLLSPATLVTNARLGLLAAEPETRPFDAAARGQLLGEAVAVVVLKPLAKAVADGDHVHGIVRATAVGHDGAGVSLTAPNPDGQADAIRRCLAAAGLTPGDVDYVEGQGTATEQGDAAELAAYAAAFAGRRPVRVGTVKGQVGHFEAASGVAALVKVLLALRHGTIPGVRNFTRLPDRLAAAPPVEIVAAPTPWPRAATPRRAGVHNFGYGGGNAHLLVEEFLPPVRTPEADRPELFVLSARDHTRLKAAAGRLADFLNQPDGPELVDVAYTLRVGREPMSHRLAVVADTPVSLTAALRAFAAGELLPPRAWAGVAARGSEARGFLSETPEGRAAVASLAAAGAWDRLAPLWVEGVTVDWAAVPPAGRRVPLPTYPFAPDRHWLPAPFSLAALAGRGGAIHPLLDRNESGFAGVRFTKAFAPGDASFTDHRLGGRELLPGAAVVEMIRAAAERAGGPAAVLTDIVWMQPVTPGPGPVEVRVELSRTAEGIEARVTGAAGIHARAKLTGDADAPPPPPELAAVAARCGPATDGAELYRSFGEVGLDYGPRFRSVVELAGTGTEGFARLRLPAAWPPDAGYGLHPALLDGAFQAVAATARRAAGGPYLPFSLGRVDVFDRLPTDVVVHVTPAAGPADGAVLRFDLTLYDPSGRPLAVCRDFALVAATRPSAATDTPSADGPGVARVLAAVARVTRTPVVALRADAPFDQLGLDSVTGQELIADLEAGGDPLPRTLLFEHPTPAALARFLNGTLAAPAPVPSVNGVSRARRPAAGPVRVMRAAAGGPVSFWAPGLPGETTWAYRLAQHLPGWGVYALEARGLARPDRADRTVGRMAAYYLKAVRAVAPHGPYVLGGISMGGLVAMEMARRLRARGEAVSDLVLLDTYPPDTDELDALRPLLGGHVMLMVMGTWLGRMWQAERPLTEADLADRPRREQVRRTVDHLLASPRCPLGRTELTRYLASMLRLTRVNARAATRYRPPADPGADRVTVFQCTGGFIRSGNVLGLPGLPQPAPTPGRGWPTRLSGPVEVHALDCDHFEVALDPYAARVAEVLRRRAAEPVTNLGHLGPTARPGRG